MNLKQLNPSFALFLFSSVLSLFVFSSCIPGTPPDNLDDTPGPAVIVADGLYSGAVFSAHYPPGWRVITGEARTPQSVIFAAPDETSTIRLVAGTLDDANFPTDQLTSVRTIQLTDGGTVTAILTAPTDVFQDLMPVFEEVLASVQKTG